VSLCGGLAEMLASRIPSEEQARLAMPAGDSMDGALLRALQVAPSEVYAEPASTFVASFIGAPPMNLVPVDISGGEIRLGDAVLVAYVVAGLGVSAGLTSHTIRSALAGMFGIKS